MRKEIIMDITSVHYLLSICLNPVFHETPALQLLRLSGHYFLCHHGEDEQKNKYYILLQ